MATNLQGSSHRPRAVGFCLPNRKGFIYEPENETEALRALFETEEAETAHIPVIKAMIKGYVGNVGRIDMVLT